MSGIYGSAGTADENLAVAILSMRAALMSWYKARHAENPSECLTRVADFSAKTVGNASKQVLKTKGAETYGILMFSLFILNKYGARIGPQWQRLLKAGKCLADIVKIWQEHDWIIPKAKRAEMMKLYCEHIALMVIFACFVPKHHLVFHLLHNAKYHGNPARYSTWLDESLNKLLKAACKNACSARFDPSALLRMRKLLKSRRGRDRRLGE